MHRRDFPRHLAAAFSFPYLIGKRAERPAEGPRRPAPLQRGDTVGLITPASYIEEEGLNRAIENLESLGLRVRTGVFIRAERGFTAGTDEQRLGDFYAMLADPEVKAIWAARGGYGSARLLPLMDFRLIRKNPKVIIGYSDITALLNAITEETGLVTFHGPVASSPFTDFTRRHLEAVLMEGSEGHTIRPSREMLEKEEIPYQLKVITPGSAEGCLVGGNLSLLSSLAGTPWAPDVKGKLLFLEDVGEKPYRLDRMLTQLRQAWPLEKTAGIILGIFKNCVPAEGDRSLGLIETLRDRLGDLGVPVIYGMPIGHIDDQATLPLGVKARLETSGPSLTLLEPALKK